MSTQFKPFRIGIFYDGNYLLHVSNYYYYFDKIKRRLSISGLHDYVVSAAEDLLSEEFPNRSCRLSELHYFRGRINAAEASQRGNQLYNDRVFDDVLMAEGVETHYLPLRNVAGRREERGTDVWLSLEVMELAMANKIDMAVLVLANADYIPLMRKLSSQGIRTMLLMWEFEYSNDEGNKVVTRTAHDLQGLATYLVDMGEIIKNGLSGNSPDPSVMDLFVQTEEVETVVESGERETSEILSLKNGYGFIKYANNNLYFHSLDVLGDFTELQEGDAVEFTRARGQQGQQIAKEVQKL